MRLTFQCFVSLLLTRLSADSIAVANSRPIEVISGRVLTSSSPYEVVFAILSKSDFALTQLLSQFPIVSLTDNDQDLKWAFVKME